MPIHDWTRVIAGIFHDFHQSWIIAIRDALNKGRLPDDYYALAEQVTEGPFPDVVTLKQGETKNGSLPNSASDMHGGVALAERPPRVEYTLHAEMEAYSRKASRVAVYHASGDRVVAYVEIVSLGNKQSEAATYETAWRGLPKRWKRVIEG